jgi:hypothetical protein
MGSLTMSGTQTGLVVGLGKLGWVDWKSWWFLSMCPIPDSVEIEIRWHVCCDVNPHPHLR